MRYLPFFILFVAFISCMSNHKGTSTEGELWTFVSKKNITQNKLLPTQYTALKLNMNLLEEKLKQEEMPEISLPLIDNTLIKVKLENAGTMSSELAKKFPNIKSYKGVEILDNLTTVRVDKNTSGFFAMITRQGKTYFLNPVEKGSTLYIVYDKQYAVRGGNPFVDKIIR